MQNAKGEMQKRADAPHFALYILHFAFLDLGVRSTWKTSSAIATGGF
jgi:hypothetical protein